MHYIIREIRLAEIPLLEDFLYEAIFIPSWYKGELPRNIIFNDRTLYNTIKNFGNEPHDYCFVADVDGKVVGAVWSRITEQYGHIDDETPSLAISLYKNYRNLGIGSKLLDLILRHLKSLGYKRVSLGVSKENFHALHVYEKVGFEIIGDGDDETEWLMVYNFSS